MAPEDVGINATGAPLQTIGEELASPHSCACHRNPVDTRLRGGRVFSAQGLGLAGFLWQAQEWGL